MSTNSTKAQNGCSGEAPALYLNLLKETLRFSLWDDPGKPLETVSYRLPRILRPVAVGTTRLLAKGRLRLVVLRDMDQERRFPGSTWPACAHTMISRQRLDNIQEAVETVIRENIPGDLIETGVWRGGSCILMRGILKAFGDGSRRIFVADSFEGLPKPDAEKYPSDAGDKHYQHDFLAVSQAQVEHNFQKYGLLDSQVVFLKGWFKDTLPAAPITQLSLMRLDGDMYESTMDALTNLYHKLSPGGYCIIDDYALSGCRAAVDEFRQKRNVKEPLVEIDHSGRYWRKGPMPRQS